MPLVPDKKYSFSEMVYLPALLDIYDQSEALKIFMYSVQQQQK